MNKLSPTAAVAASVAIVLAIIGAVTVLALEGKDTTPLLGVIPLVVAPFLLNLYTVFKVVETTNTLADVKEQVNGHLQQHTAPPTIVNPPAGSNVTVVSHGDVNVSAPEDGES